MGSLMTLENLLLGLGLLAGGGVFLYRALSKASAEEKTRRLVVFQDVVASAWHAVDAVSKGTANTVDDKVALALKKVAEVMAAQTGKPLDAGETAMAKLKLEALEGARAAGLLTSTSPPTPR